jgi:hypothetical protein
MRFSATLEQAVSQNLCFAWMDPQDADYLRTILDVPEDSIIDMAEPQGISRASLSDLSATGQVCVEDSFDPFEIANASQLLQDFFVSTGRLLCEVSDDRPELGQQGVVLHMRSGDIMAPVRPGVDPQPPCNFYASVVMHGNNGSAFDHVLIVTEPDFLNPCIRAMESWFPSKVKVQSRSVREDACVVATAKNLATAAYSTFDAGLIRLNARLMNLHVPMGNENQTQYYIDHNRWIGNFTPWIVREKGMRYAQHVYSFPRYSTYWRSYGEMAERMSDYPQESILKHTIPAMREATTKHTRRRNSREGYGDDVYEIENADIVSNITTFRLKRLQALALG